MKDYSLENLVDIFSKHADDYEKEESERLQNFKQSNPNASIPEYMSDSFNLPRALLSVCQEIINIKGE